MMPHAYVPNVVRKAKDKISAVVFLEFAGEETVGWGASL